HDSMYLAYLTSSPEVTGVTLLLPRDWTTMKTSVRPQEVEEEPGELKGSGVGLWAMVSFRWRVAVGDTELTEEEMDEIREAQSELVRLRGQWVRLDASTLRAAERFLEAFGSRTRTERRQQRGAAGPSAPDRALEQRPTAAPAAELPPPAPVPAEIEGRAPWMEMF